MRKVGCARRLFSKVAEKPEEDRQHKAENKAGDDRKVEGGVFATMDDIAGKFSEAEWQSATEVKKGAKNNQEPTKKQNSATEFAKGFHRGILPEWLKSPSECSYCGALSYYLIYDIDKYCPSTINTT